MQGSQSAHDKVASNEVPPFLTHLCKPESEYSQEYDFKSVYVGQFTLQSGRMCVADPCYGINLDTTTFKLRPWSNVFEASNGTWQVMYDFGEYYGYIDKPMVLRLYHQDFASQLVDPDAAKWEKTEFLVHVDTGCVAAYDPQKRIDTIRQDSSIGSNQAFGNELWDIHNGVNEFAACVESGVGDGSYEMYWIKNESGVVVAVKVEFC